MKMKVTKAIIPAAGFGTRMLPQTKAVPKEMLPIIDKPIIQYIVEEVVSAGIKDIIVVTGYHKRAIEDHFDNSYELLEWLKKNKKKELYKEVKHIISMANFIYLRQKGLYGNAIPIKISKHLIKDEPFLLLWGDIIADYARTKKAIKAFDKYQAPILCGTKTSSKEDLKRYGYVKGKEVKKGLWKVEKIIEKPGTSKGHSNIAIMNGYVLTPDILPLVDELKKDKNGEYCLIEAIDKLAKQRDVFAIDLGETMQYDTGNKIEYLKTIVEFALKDKSVSKEFRDFIKSKL